MAAAAMRVLFVTLSQSRRVRTGRKELQNREHAWRERRHRELDVQRAISVDSTAGQLRRRLLQLRVRHASGSQRFEEVRAELLALFRANRASRAKLEGA